MALLELLSSFDLQTATFLVGIGLLIHSGLIAIQAVLIREYQGVRTAAMANLCIAIGTLLIVMRGSTSDVVSVILANYIMVFDSNLLYDAVSRFMGRPSNQWVMVLSALSVYVLFPYYTFIQNTVVVRTMIMGFALALPYALTAWSLLSSPKGVYQQTGNFLGGVLAFNSLVLVLRGIGLKFYPVQDLFDFNWVLVISAIFMFMTTFLIPTGFLLMVGQRLQGDLNEIATIDSLTHVTNRRGMIRILEAEFANKARTLKEFSVLLVDVDHFKNINDRYGHEVGDKSLITVAQVLKGAIRPKDSVSRWGGDEFLILLPATDEEGPEIAERLRVAVEQEKINLNDLNISLTVSIGIGRSDICSDIDAIYKYADQALYKAKQLRNMVACNGI
ncbi:MAG TPA: GGDEF domain-containing protein [Anaerolineales bacterium]|nr:GGDEF domain-containing protein [Anaerolineales bacterium]